PLVLDVHDGLRDGYRGLGTGRRDQAGERQESEGETKGGPHGGCSNHNPWGQRNGSHPDGEMWYIAVHETIAGRARRARPARLRGTTTRRGRGAAMAPASAGSAGRGSSKSPRAESAIALSGSGSLL